MAIVGWAIGGVLLGIAANADDEYSESALTQNLKNGGYSDYSDYSNYNDAAERERQRQLQRERAVNDARYDLEIFVQSEMLPFLQQNSIQQHLIDDTNKYHEIENDFAFQCKMEKIRATQQLNDELKVIEALIGRIDTIMFNIE